MSNVLDLPIDQVSVFFPKMFCRSKFKQEIIICFVEGVHSESPKVLRDLSGAITHDICRFIELNLSKNRQMKIEVIVK